MGQIVALVIGAAALALFFWLFFVPGKSDAANSGDAAQTDDREIATLIGLTGGSIEDAAIARFALRRFEEEHGRKATAQKWGSWRG